MTPLLLFCLRVPLVSATILLRETTLTNCNELVGAVRELDKRDECVVLASEKMSAMAGEAPGPREQQDGTRSV